MREEVIIAFLPVAEQLARRFRNRGESYQDLKQVASLALIQSIDRFDPDRGAFFPFAVTTIVGELKRHMRDKIWAIRPPRNLQELSVDVRWTEAHLAVTLGHTATVAEVASYLNVTEEMVLEARNARRSRFAVSLHAPIIQDVSLVDILGAEDHRLDEIDCWISLRDVIAKLPSRTRRILQLRFGEDLTQMQIAELVGISQMHVSRIISTTMAKMKIVLEGFAEASKEEKARRRRKARYE